MSAKRPFFGRKTKKTGLTKTQKKGVRTIVKKKLDELVEDKNFDLAIVNGGVDSTGQIADLTFIQQGAGQGQRLGDRIKLKMLELRLVLDTKRPSLLVSVNTSFRFVIFRHKQNSANFTPLVTSPIPTAAFVGTSAATCFTYNLDNRDAYSIVYDSGPMVPKNQSIDGTISVNKKFKLGSHVQYNTGAPTVTAGVGKLYAMWITDNVAGIFSTLNASIRLIYEDA